MITLTDPPAARACYSRVQRRLRARGVWREEYRVRHVEVHNRRPDKPQANYRLYLKYWENRRLSHIKRADIQALHAMLVAGGIGRAAEVKPILRTKKNAASS